MYRRLLVLLSKILIKILRLFGKNGSALPGLIIERLCPDFLSKVLKTSEKKIILITGTNGKTTTTKMVVAGLRGAGLKIVTNSTGSNMTRGLIAALIEDMTYLGSLRPTDWFVFEMDEAYAPIFTEKLSPKLLLALNVLRDQLDRYGEVDITANLIKVAAAKSDTFVFSGMDTLLVAASKELNDSSAAKLISFGVSPDLEPRVTNEQTGRGNKLEQIENDFVLTSARETPDGQNIEVKEGLRAYKLSIPMRGFHNSLNLTAAIAIVAQVAKSETSFQKAEDAISMMPTPFGRGEKMHIKGKDITVALVKNPSGFISNLATFVQKTKPDVVIIAINDRLADGRDVSWLWDVQFTGIIPESTRLLVAGIRRYDMALRLRHDNIESELYGTVQASIDEIFNQDKANIVIIPTYTALFEVRSSLSKHGKVPRIW